MARSMIARILLVLVLAAGAVAGGLWLDFNAFLKRPVELPEEGVVFDIPRGASLRGLARQMTDDGILEHPYYFIALAYLKGIKPASRPASSS
jgi:UPF0755 protein